MFKKYRATKANVILLEKAMLALYGDAAKEKVCAEKDYKWFKYSNWHNMFDNIVNAKMQEIEKATQQLS